jgi:mevalonate kinase
MPTFSASAPGKIILFGEHAVVYGYSAIAVPVTQVSAKVTLTPNIHGEPGLVLIDAPDIRLESDLTSLPDTNPIKAAIHGLLAHLKTDHIPACTLKIKSTIPVASGLGSGAAVSVAIIRVLAGFLGERLPDETVSRLAFEVEKIHHGTPSGIDNTVITYQKPVYFTKDHPIETFRITSPFHIVIGDTGIASPTIDTVGDVRAAWQADPPRFNCLFTAINSITKTARQTIEGGYPERLGPLMDENHQLLREMGVSSPALERLVEAAKAAGASGAKLSGGGRGGNMIALVDPTNAEAVASAIQAAGAKNTISTTVQDRRDSATV